MSIDLTEKEQSIIESALNHYWNDAVFTLDNNYTLGVDGSKLPLGDVHKQLLKQRVNLVEPLIRKFENL